MGISWGTKKILAGLLAVMFVVGCSDGGIDGSGGQKPEVIVEGTAATGAPITETNIYIKGKFGNRVQVETDLEGKFSVDVASLTAPYVLKTNVSAGRSLFSIAMAKGTVNINPLTNLVAHNLFASLDRSLAIDFSADDGFPVLPTAEELAAVVASFNRLFLTAYQDFLVPDGFSFMSSVFVADHSGFDALLDNLLVSIVDGLVSVALTDPVTSIVGYLIVNIDIAFDFTQVDGEAPTLPQNVAANASGTESVRVVWTPSTDNVAVAGYTLYRDGNEVATVSVPVFNDVGLTSATEYCYRVEAFDSGGVNVSAQTDAVCATTLSAADSVIPSLVMDLSVVTVSDSSIDLGWTASTETDVFGYYIYRKTTGDLSLVGTITASSYRDSGLDAETDYCYSVRAFDASLNVSDYSAEACDTTDVMTQAGGADTTAPDVSAAPAGGNFSAPQTVVLSCYDNGESGCAATYFTTDGTDPTVDSGLYTGSILINASAELRYFSVDNAGNSSAVTSASFTITLPPTNSMLSVINNDLSGSVVSDVSGIDCGTACVSSFDSSAQVTLTATHPDGLVAVWAGCTSVTTNECTALMNRDRTVLVSFVAVTSEIAVNDSFADSQLVLDTSVITGFYNAVDDVDFFRIDVAERSTFKAVLSHGSSRGNLNLYDGSFQHLTGNNNSSPQFAYTVTWSLVPGTYYIRVRSGNVTNLVEPWTLTLSGTALGGPTPDVHEENDVFASAVDVTANGDIQGYYDTVNDIDMFSFTVTQRSTFKAVLSHGSSRGNLNLYDGSFQHITGNNNSSPQFAYTVTWSLVPGTYYIRVRSGNVSNLLEPWTLTLSGTALGGTTPDVHEENDVFASAVDVTANGDIQGYYDTLNDIDMFSFTVTQRSTFKAELSHGSSRGNLNLYDENFTHITGNNNSSPQFSYTVTWSLVPGTYYIRVRSGNISNLLEPWTLTLSGTALGGTTPDAHEENDVFASAVDVTANGDIQGYYDTLNDIDMFSFTVTQRSTFKAELSHGSSRGNLNLYDESFQHLTGNNNSSPQFAYTVTWSLVPGTYYIRVRSGNISNLLEPWTLTLSGTALGGTTPDIHEENDVFASATAITDNASYSGYLDTLNDVDFYVLNVAVAGVLDVSVAHPSARSALHLFDDQFQLVTGTSLALSNTMNATVLVGTYYIRVLSGSVSDLTTPYDLTIAAIQ